MAESLIEMAVPAVLSKFCETARGFVKMATMLCILPLAFPSSLARIGAIPIGIFGGKTVFYDWKTAFWSSLHVGALLAPCSGTFQTVIN